jgi:hypothetical protein
MKGADVSFLRKEQPGYWVPGTVFLLGEGELWKYFLECRLRGNDT